MLICAGSYYASKAPRPGWQPPRKSGCNGLYIRSTIINIITLIDDCIMRVEWQQRAALEVR